MMLELWCHESLRYGIGSCNSHGQLEPNERLDATQPYLHPHPEHKTVEHRQPLTLEVKGVLDPLHRVSRVWQGTRTTLVAGMSL